MKQLLFIFGITLFSIFSNAQTPYYYYYNGKKQYLSLNTEYAFLSVKEPQQPVGIEQRSITVAAFRTDKSNKKQHMGNFGTVLLARICNPCLPLLFDLLFVFIFICLFLHVARFAKPQ